jgi:hypothetical protein
MPWTNPYDFERPDREQDLEDHNVMSPIFVDRLRTPRAYSGLNADGMTLADGDAWRG